LSIDLLIYLFNKIDVNQMTSRDGNVAQYNTLHGYWDEVKVKLIHVWNSTVSFHRL